MDGKTEQDHQDESPQVPVVPLNRAALQAIDSVLKAYQSYLRSMAKQMGKGGKQGQQGRQLQDINDLRRRIGQALVTWEQQGQQLLLNGEEFAALSEAMSAYIRLLRRLFPRTPERDVAIESVQELRRHIDRMLAGDST